MAVFIRFIVKTSVCMVRVERVLVRPIPAFYLTKPTGPY